MTVRTTTESSTTSVRTAPVALLLLAMIGAWTVIDGKLSQAIR
jgi:hypothetical protein